MPGSMKQVVSDFGALGDSVGTYLAVIRARFAEHEIFAADESTKHDWMLRSLSVPPAGTGRGSESLDSTSMNKVGYLGRFFQSCFLLLTRSLPFSEASMPFDAFC